MVELKHIVILRIIRKEDKSIISERDMATLSEEENVEISNKLNSNSTGYLGYEQDKTA